MTAEEDARARRRDSVAQAGTAAESEIAAILGVAHDREYVLNLLAGILGTLPVAVGIYDGTDRDYRVLYLNPATESFAGPVTVPYQGRGVLEVYPDAIQNEVVQLLDEAMTTGRPQSREDFVSHTDRVFNVDVYPVRGPEGTPLLLQVAQEITEVFRGRERLALGVEMAIDLSARLEPREVLARLLKRAVSSAKADRGTVSRLEGDEVVVEGSYDPGGQPIPAGSRWQVDVQPILREAVRRRRAVRGDQPVAPETLTPAIRESIAPIRHVLAVPMVIGGEVVGVLVLSRLADRPFTDADEAVLAQIATVAAYSLRNARLYQQAQEANRAKAEFMNMAAHELRTPLSVIAGYVSLLKDGSLGEGPASWSDPMRVIAAKVDELTVLVDDVLTAARLESGSIPAGAERLDAREIVAAAVERVHPRVDLLHATFEVDIEDRPAPVRVNAAHIARIIDNLVNNALTYSHSPFWIRAEMRVAGTSVEISIEDHGKGIPEEARSKIFDQFVRIEDPGFGYPPGTGLGLYISRKLAEANGGTLSLASSEVGQGSRFTLRLPLVHGAGRRQDA